MSSRSDAIGSAASHLPGAEVSSSPGSLRNNYLRLPEVVAQSIGLVGASGGVGLLIPSVFAATGNGTWLAYLFAAITLLFATWSISQFAKRTASPGALYVYAARGLGPLWGIIAGWALLVAYIVGAAGILEGTTQEFLVVLQDVRLVGQTKPPALVVAMTLLLGFVAWYVSYRDIRLSTRLSLGIELSTVTLILIVVLGWLLVRGPMIDTRQWSLDGVHVGQLRIGVVLAFFSFTGFESAAVLGLESRDPFNTIPRAIRISIMGPAILFLIASYGLVAAFQNRVPSLSDTDAPLSVVANSLHLGWLSVFINAGVALSFLAALFSSINAGARVLYAFARQGLFYSAAGRAHRVNSTPHVAVSLIALFSVVVGLVFTLSGARLFDSYGWLSSVATYGFLLTYSLVAVGAPFYLRRLGLLERRHIVISGILLVLLSIPLVGSVYPVPEGAYRWLPYAFIALIALGLGWYFILRRWSPHTLKGIEEAALTG
jgi:amino acid transporter